MKIVVTLEDRMVFNGLFPQSSNIIDQVIIKDLSNKTSLNQDIIKQVCFETINSKDGTSYKWNTEKAKEIEKEIEFSEPESKFLKEQVTRLDKEKKVSKYNLDICLKIRDAK